MTEQRTFAEMVQQGSGRGLDPDEFWPFQYRSEEDRMHLSAKIMLERGDRIRLTITETGDTAVFDDWDIAMAWVWKHDPA